MASEVERLAEKPVRVFSSIGAATLQRFQSGLFRPLESIRGDAKLENIPQLSKRLRQNLACYDSREFDVFGIGRRVEHASDIKVLLEQLQRGRLLGVLLQSRENQKLEHRANAFAALGLTAGVHPQKELNGGDVGGVVVCRQHNHLVGKYNLFRATEAVGAGRPRRKGAKGYQHRDKSTQENPWGCLSEMGHLLAPRSFSRCLRRCTVQR